MDTAAILEQYTQDISNLPAELQHLLSELGTSDSNLYEVRRKVLQKDSTIHKFIKQHGSLTKNPKENQLYPKIRDDFRKAEQIQRAKLVTANTGLFLTAKHLVKLESDIEKLKAEGLLALDELDIDSDDELFSSKPGSRASTAAAAAAASIGSALGNGHGISSIDLTPSNTNTNTNSTTVKKQSRKSQAPKSSTPNATNTTSTSRPQKRQRNEDSKTPDPKIESVIPNASSNLKISTKAPKVENNANEEENELYCFCQRVSFGEMVGCDNDDCKFEWFHYECVGLKEPPKGKWYCSDCIERQKVKETKKKRKQ
ncbi:Inhibitor of growth protein 5 [Wickerhamomyces ciferrii]|uniref:Chromatin modification-related protein n=1 Tax=Wickerhamomyces ciferrii (strain ATCC 14091 / BCRC 22168 / CBS 111 / JCM 3599 / NBRC 0793 / NRRL Y-1031 F-60-10) TaxID=1206466 RepID=K0KPL6_WICCF|nr:Inhibitor of growth protein 5 [Wickerhamomyces ciferrii]CCH44107.1 Inhibitor of growth protein 5 [Wickerhamomyces ciferrii]